MKRIKYTNTRGETVKIRLKTGFAILPGNGECILGELVDVPSFVQVAVDGPAQALVTDENGASVLQAAEEVPAPAPAPKKKKAAKKPAAKKQTEE
jgi:hypothetical protein